MEHLRLLEGKCGRILELFSSQIQSSLTYILRHNIMSLILSLSNHSLLHLNYNPFSFMFLKHLHTSGAIAASRNYKLEVTNLPRQAKMLTKLMTGSRKASRKNPSGYHHISQTFLDVGILSNDRVKGVKVTSKKSQRRIEVFNTLLMEHITSLMSTGESSSEILGLGVTVSRVKISCTFTIINVYWVATGTDKDAVIEPILKRTAGFLRHELSQLRIMGVVPPIEFVKDKTSSKSTEVEFLLTKCDFGEDFVPTKPSKLFVQMGANESNGILEDSTVGPGNRCNEVAIMRQDMLGIKHDIIMAQVKDMLKRVKRKKEAIHLQKSELESEETCSDFLSESSLKSVREEVAETKKRQNDFFKYLKKRQLEKKSELKQPSSEAKEKEFLEEEANSSWKHFIDSPYFEDDEDNYDAKDEDWDYEQSYLKSEFKN